MKSLEGWAIDAYADNELEAADRAEVERLLAEQPEARARLEDIRRQNEALRQAFAGVLEEDVPAGLVRTARLQPPAARQGRWWMSAAAAAIALLAVGAGGGWLAAGRLQGVPAQGFVDVAVGAHTVYARENRHPVEVTAAEQDHLQKWLSKRIGVSFKVPDMNDQGYQLLGGRLLADGGRPAALLMYEDAEKRRLTIYIASNPAKSTGELEVLRVGHLTACHWEEPDMVYALIGEQPESEMRQLAAVAHERFDS